MAVDVLLKENSNTGILMMGSRDGDDVALSLFKLIQGPFLPRHISVHYV
jgi:hypothetical protein